MTDNPNASAEHKTDGESESKYMVFVTRVPAALEVDEADLDEVGTSEQAFGIITRHFRRKVDEVKEDAGECFEAASELVAKAADKVPRGFQLDEITFSLGFDAKGSLVWIAEAGITASVEVKFKRI